MVLHGKIKGTKRKARNYQWPQPDDAQLGKLPQPHVGEEALLVSMGYDEAAQNEEEVHSKKRVRKSRLPCGVRSNMRNYDRQGGHSPKTIKGQKMNFHCTPALRLPQRQ
jgi:hypothetical protein